MTQGLRFDVAISSVRDDAWIAKDLSNLIKRSGFSVYCYLHQPDLIQGFLRPRLRDIYADSSLNILVWSKNYSAQPDSTIPAMERRCISMRHVDKGEASSLLILCADETPLDRDLEPILAHTAIEAFVIQRLKTLWSRDTHEGLLRHPPGTEQARGPLLPCTFTVHPSYQSDPLRRWENLADVRVRCEITKSKSAMVYLIPSGLATPFLRHSTLLRVDPTLLKRKRLATIAFVRQWQGRSLEGFWFTQKKEEMEFPTIYCPTYDAFLNKSYGSSS
jgi:hypothetical protein